MYVSSNYSIYPETYHIEFIIYVEALSEVPEHHGTVLLKLEVTGHVLSESIKQTVVYRDRPVL